MTRRQEKLRARLGEILAWLEADYPTRWGGPIRLRLEAMPRISRGVDAEVVLQEPPLIRVSRTLRRSDAILALLHEYSHLRVERRNASASRTWSDQHGEKFWIEYGRLEAGFFKRWPGSPAGRV